MVDPSGSETEPHCGRKVYLCHIGESCRCICDVCEDWTSQEPQDKAYRIVEKFMSELNRNFIDGLVDIVDAAKHKPPLGPWAKNTQQYAAYVTIITSFAHILSAWKKIQKLQKK